MDIIALAPSELADYLVNRVYRLACSAQSHARASRWSDCLTALADVDRRLAATINALGAVYAAQAVADGR